MKFDPTDALDRELVALTHPPDWVNPIPDGRYNLVAIGGGTSGLVAAIGASRLGGRAALIEGGLMGGDCLNWGCVPSKALIATARVAHSARDAERFGVRTGPVSVDFAAVMQRMRRIRTQIAHHDSFDRVREEGVDTFKGTARFTSPDTVEVGGVELRFARAVIATGARASLPPIPGLAQANPLTNETVFQLTELPARLLVIGGGPIGCELAQVFARFGSAVTLVELADRLLLVDDPEAADIIERCFTSERIEVLTGAVVEGVEPGSATVLHRGRRREIGFDQVLVATGRVANTEELGLEAAGVRSDGRGVFTNTWFQTDNPRIYAAGDVARGLPQLTHVADESSRRVLRNALFFGRMRKEDMVIPWATYTDPEVAHVGLSWQEVQDRGLPTFRYELAAVDRAILDGDTTGFVKIALGGRRIVSGTVVGAHAGELIGTLCLAVSAGLSGKQLSDTVQPYPTRVDALRRVGFAFQQTRLTASARQALELLLRWRR